MSDHHLTVLRDFGGYRCGDRIEDAKEIEAVLKGENSTHVVRIRAPAKVATTEEPKLILAPTKSFKDEVRA